MSLCLKTICVIYVLDMALPSDPVMLMSVINQKLRDYYPSLEALCDDLALSPDDLKAQLAAAGFEYLPEVNQFR